MRQRRRLRALAACLTGAAVAAAAAADQTPKSDKPGTAKTWNFGGFEYTKDPKDGTWRSKMVDEKGARARARAKSKAKAEAKASATAKQALKPDPDPKVKSQGWPKLWANFKTLVGISSQTSGPTCDLWANPVNFR
jgi:hypothetical protein